MAKEVDTGMDKQEMKRLLMLARKDPMNCAFAQGPDPKFALLMIEKVKAGRAIVQELNKKFSDAKNPRFGTVHIDADEDPKLAIFQIDKPVATMAKRLAKTLKGTGITKVEIQLGDGTPVESAAEEEESETGASETEETVQAQTTQGVPPPPPPPPQAPQRDAGELTRMLTEQVRRIPGVLAVAPGLKEQLTKFATDAQVNIKTGNLTYAATYIEQLRRALDAAPTGTQQGAPSTKPPEGAKVTYAKSRLAWLAARKKVESDIEKLRAEIVASFEEEGRGPELDSLYRGRVAPMLETLDESLADKLDEAMNEADPARHQKLLTDAKTIIQRYTDYVNGEKLIDDLDDNPFVPLTIRATLTGTLNTLAKTVV